MYHNYEYINSYKHPWNKKECKLALCDAHVILTKLAVSNRREPLWNPFRVLCRNDQVKDTNRYKEVLATAIYTYYNFWTN